MRMRVCFWSLDRGMLLRVEVHSVPARGELVKLRDLGLAGRVIGRDFATADDGTEELLIQLQLEPDRAEMP
ncbi:hypothetical protein Q9R08_20805 [Microbacterium sp. QXD-8]|uniref:Uncharacterized protein n=1 Tax=Microbacterium psychrotolerans TaxID=3068321 RepID=A0ABU0Z754_9MICO|nr:hypothetical protein [Microbacterium sp. QXD-8]MDQ7880438.1 hypothetical protein [Microbacterium sp. QXD-8]